MIWTTETIDNIEVDIIVKSEVCATDQEEAKKEDSIYFSSKPVNILDCN